MPQYTYKCKECGAIEERSHSIKDHENFLKLLWCQKPATAERSEKCQGHYQSIIGQTSFQLKGKSWAKDGYK